MRRLVVALVACALAMPAAGDDAPTTSYLLGCYGRSWQSTTAVARRLAMRRDERVESVLAKWALSDDRNGAADTARKLLVEWDAVPCELARSSFDVAADPAHRMRAMSLLSHCGDAGLDALFLALTDEDASVAASAAWELCWFGPAALPRIERLLSDDRPRVRTAASQAVARMAETGRFALLRIDGQPGGAPLADLDPFVPLLIDMAHSDEDPGVRAQARHALVSLQRAEAGPLLLHAIATEPGRAGQSAEDLARLGHEALPPHLAAGSEAKADQYSPRWRQVAKELSRPELIEFASDLARRSDLPIASSIVAFMAALGDAGATAAVREVGRRPELAERAMLVPLLGRAGQWTAAADVARIGLRGGSAAHADYWLETDATALAEHGGPSDASHLAPLLTRLSVAPLACDALGRWRTPECVALLRVAVMDVQAHRCVASTLADLEGAVPLLIDVALAPFPEPPREPSSGCPGPRLGARRGSAALSALARIHPHGTQFLLASALGDPDRALEIAGSLAESPPADPAELKDLVESPDPRHVEAAAMVLAAMPDAASARLLEKILDSPNRRLPWLLMRLTDAHAFEVLGHELASADRGRRLAAVRAMADSRECEAEDLLVVAMGDTDREVSVAAAGALLRLGRFERVGAALRLRQPGIWDAVTSALSDRMATLDRDLLATLLADDRPAPKRMLTQAAALEAALRTPRLVTVEVALSAARGDESSRRLAPRLLAAVGGARAGAALLPLTSDADPGVRAAAAMALPRILFDRAIPPLERLRSDAAPSVATAAGLALASIENCSCLVP